MDAEKVDADRREVRNRLMQFLASAKGHGDLSFEGKPSWGEALGQHFVVSRAHRGDCGCQLEECAVRGAGQALFELIVENIEHDWGALAVVLPKALEAVRSANNELAPVRELVDYLAEAEILLEKDSTLTHVGVQEVVETLLRTQSDLELLVGQFEGRALATSQRNRVAAMREGKGTRRPADDLTAVVVGILTREGFTRREIAGFIYGKENVDSRAIDRIRQKEDKELLQVEFAAPAEPESAGKNSQD